MADSFLSICPLISSTCFLTSICSASPFSLTRSESSSSFALTCRDWVSSFLSLEDSSFFFLSASSMLSCVLSRFFLISKYFTVDIWLSNPVFSSFNFLYFNATSRSDESCSSLASTSVSMSVDF